MAHPFLPPVWPADGGSSPALRIVSLDIGVLQLLTKISPAAEVPRASNISRRSTRRAGQEKPQQTVQEGTGLETANRQNAHLLCIHNGTSPPDRKICVGLIVKACVVDVSVVNGC